MDAETFDRLIADVSRRPTRRSTLRLLAAGLLGALLPTRAGAQRQDSDQDGLFDEDEINSYGTKPDVADTDGDGFGDGQEICNRDGIDPNCQQDQVHTNPLVNENAAPRPADPPPPPVNPPPPPAVPCGPGLTSCGDYCADLATDHGNCGGCGNRCSQIGSNYNCERGVCIRVCSLDGETCRENRDCCGNMTCIYGGYCVQQ